MAHLRRGVAALKAGNGIERDIIEVSEPECMVWGLGLLSVLADAGSENAGMNQFEIAGHPARRECRPRQAGSPFGGAVGFWGRRIDDADRLVQGISGVSVLIAS
jgi:hypothetical protein